MQVDDHIAALVRSSAKLARISEDEAIARILYRHYSLTGIAERIREDMGEENLLDEDEAIQVAVEAVREVRAEAHRNTLAANLPNLPQPRRGHRR